MTKKIFITGLLALTVLTLQGCYTVSAGPEIGSVAFVMGELQAERSENLEEVHESVLETFEEMNIRVIEEEQDAVQSRIIGRDEEDRRIRVQLERTPEDYTSIGIKVGALGSEEYSTDIYSQVVGQLTGREMETTADNGMDNGQEDDMEDDMEDGMDNGMDNGVTTEQQLEQRQQREREELEERQQRETEQLEQRQERETQQFEQRQQDQPQQQQRQETRDQDTNAWENNNNN